MSDKKSTIEVLWPDFKETYNTEIKDTLDLVYGVTADKTNVHIVYCHGDDSAAILLRMGAPLLWHHVGEVLIDYENLCLTYEIF